MMRELEMLPVRQLMIMCAPVLFADKPAQFLAVREEAETYLRGFARASGLSAMKLYDMPRKLRRQGRNGMLVYRGEALWECLEKEENREFLLSCGYPDGKPQMLRECSDRLQKYHWQMGEFPHEMGILLGYPVWDVEEYIKNHGTGYLINGYWKVYRRPEEAALTFEAYDRAKERVRRGTGTAADR